MRGRSCPCAEPCSFCSCAPPPAGPPSCTNLKQETITGDLVGISDKEIVIKAASGNVTTPIDQVLTLTFGQQAGALPANVPWVDVELTDGTELHCASSPSSRTQGYGDAAGRAGGDVPAVGAVVDAGQRPPREEPQGVGRRAGQDLAHPRRGRPSTTDAVPNAVEGLIGDADESGETIHFTLPSGTGRQAGAGQRLRPGLQPQARTPTPPSVQCRLSDTHHNLVMVSGGRDDADRLHGDDAGRRQDRLHAGPGRQDGLQPRQARLPLRHDAVQGGSEVLAVRREHGVDQYHDWHYRRDLNLDDKAAGAEQHPLREGPGAARAHGVGLRPQGRLPRVPRRGRHRPRGAGSAGRWWCGSTATASSWPRSRSCAATRTRPAACVPVVRNIKDVKKLRIVVTHLDDGQVPRPRAEVRFGRRVCEQVSGEPRAPARARCPARRSADASRLAR